jgi:hypothetical protein
MRRTQMRATVSCCVLRKRLRNEATCAAGLYRQPFHVQLMRMLGCTSALIVEPAIAAPRDVGRAARVGVCGKAGRGSIARGL